MDSVGLDVHHIEFCRLTESSVSALFYLHPVVAPERIRPGEGENGDAVAALLTLKVIKPFWTVRILSLDKANRPAMVNAVLVAYPRSVGISGPIRVLRFTAGWLDWGVVITIAMIWCGYWFPGRISLRHGE